MSMEARRVLRILDTSWPLSRTANGRPYFTDGHADFSLSHSRNLTATAYVTRAIDSNARIGCDVQYACLARRHDLIRERYFRREEQDARTEREFYRLWALKEAWLKLCGLSIFEIERAPAFITGAACRQEEPLVENDPVYYLYEILIPPAERYTLAAALLPDGSPYMPDPIIFLCGKRSEGKHILLAGPEKLEMAAGEWGVVQGDWRKLHRNMALDMDESQEARTEWDVDRLDAVPAGLDGAEREGAVKRAALSWDEREAEAAAAEGDAGREAEYAVREGRVVMRNRHVTITRIPVEQLPLEL
jgi:hypothetical protein